MSEVMQLCKWYEPSKLLFPVLVSEKLDGVPGVYTREKLVSRQNKALPGVQWIHDELKLYIPKDYTVIGEHYERGKAFKDISGNVRKSEKYLGAKLCIFDFVRLGYENTPLDKRLGELAIWYEALPSFLKEFVLVIEQQVTFSIAGIDLFMRSLIRGVHEGAVVRSCSGVLDYTRSWDSQKIVFDELLDLKVVGYEEAISQNGVRKGMVGALYVEFDRKTVKIGAGKLSHTERKKVFEDFHAYYGKICKVKAKIDGTYSKLRQATFQAWHEDKVVADGEE